MVIASNLIAKSSALNGAKLVFLKANIFYNKNSEANRRSFRAAVAQVRVRNEFGTKEFPHVIKEMLAKVDIGEVREQQSMEAAMKMMGINQLKQSYFTQETDVVQSLQFCIVDTVFSECVQPHEGKRGDVVHAELLRCAHIATGRTHEFVVASQTLELMSNLKVMCSIDVTRSS